MVTQPLKSWLFGGNAVFHLRNKSGNELIYKIVTFPVPCGCSGGCPSCEWTGNVSCYSVFLLKNTLPVARMCRKGFLGVVNQGETSLHLTKKSVCDQNDPAVKSFEWMLGIIMRGKSFPQGYGVYSRRCGRCGEETSEQHIQEYRVCDVCLGATQKETSEIPLKRYAWQNIMSRLK